MKISPTKNQITVDGISHIIHPQGWRVLWALMCHKRIDRNIMSEILWPDPDEMPDQWLKVIGVVIHRLNETIRLHGYNVKGTYGWGWSLEYPT